MTTKMTPLFPMSVKPRRSGVYSVQDAYCGEMYSFWFRGKWRTMKPWPDEAAGQTSRSICAYNGTIIGWRGFTEEQEKV